MFIQVPLFWHGLNFSHSSWSIRIKRYVEFYNFIPLVFQIDVVSLSFSLPSIQSLLFHPIVQLHAYEPFVLIHVPLLEQGEDSHSFTSREDFKKSGHRNIS